MKKKWKEFGAVIVEPFNIVLLVVLLAMYGAGFADLKGAMGVLSQGVLALVSGVLGARIASGVADLNDGGILRARGTVSVRGLRLLLKNLNSLERRVQFFKTEAAEDGAGQKRLTDAHYDEIVEMARAIQEQAVSSIENWTDIVPEAQQGTLVGQMTELKNIIGSLENDRARLASELEAYRGQSREEKERLEADLANRQRLLSEAQAQLRKVQLDSILKPISDISGTGATRLRIGSVFARSAAEHAVTESLLGSVPDSKKPAKDS